MMRRVFAGRYLPILIILVLLILPNLFGQFRSQDADAPVLLVLFLILLAVYAWAAVSFGYRYWKLKDRLKNDARADLRRKYRQGLPGRVAGLLPVFFRTARQRQSAQKTQ